MHSLCLTALLLASMPAGPSSSSDPFSSPPAGAIAGGINQADNNPSAVQPDIPPPQNPSTGSYEDGKIQILVGAQRHFGHRIGDEIPLVILILVDPGVQLNFSALSRGILSQKGQSFEVVAPPLIRPVQEVKGKLVWRVDITLRTFVPRRAIVFNADILYSLGSGSAGQTPEWTQLTTPDFTITTSNTAGPGTDFLDGLLDPAPLRLSWFTYPFLLSGLILTLWWPSLLLLQWYRRRHPPRVVPPNELAWRTFNEAFADGHDFGFHEGHYRRIASALRRYLQVESATLPEVYFLYGAHPHLDSIKGALSKCEGALYAHRPLTEDESLELLNELKTIVPQP